MKWSNKGTDHAKNAIFGLKMHMDVFAQIIGAQRGNANAKIDCDWTNSFCAAKNFIIPSLDKLIQALLINLNDQKFCEGLMNDHDKNRPIGYLIIG